MPHKNDVVIVGSGPSMFGARLGKTIDEFGTVVRFNRYETGGRFAEHVGTKTDIWVTWGLHARSAVGLRAVWQPIIGPVKIDRCTHELRVACAKAAVPFLVMPSEVVADTYNQMGLYFHSEQKPTSGMVTLTYFLTALGWEHVYACGFDHFNRRDPEHYYSPPGHMPLSHRVAPKREAEYYLKLVTEGRVRPLTYGGEETCK